MNKRIAVIIPAYNEERSIAGVVRSVSGLSGFVYDPVVINDNSTDKTSDEATLAGATVINLPCQLGIGGAVQTGFKYALEKGYDVCVQTDGDGQHLASEIPKLIGPILSGDFDLVIGSRFVSDTGYEASFMRGLGITIISLFLRVTTGIRVKDTTSGFRAAGRRAFAFFSSEYPQDYPEPESLVYAYQKKFRVLEISTRMIDREYGRSSITPIRAMYYMVKVLLAMFVDLFRKT
ncbi:MAG TPA: glycosyl transferase family 2 [Deltaproteobacteria bacterium]|nr:glycosyl transferase family 2 [Deltaproteobacteria bacterium]